MSNTENITEVKLNQDQQDAVEQICEFARGPNLFFRMDGAAGTGKSTTAAFAAQELLSDGIQLALSAPTNKATRNLATFKEKISPTATIPTGTIYSLLGLVLGNNGEVREIETTDQHKMEGVKLCVVDESSMLNMAVMGHIHDFATETNTKIVFMGDPRYQLPPVNEDSSAVERLHRNVNLTKVERHDNQILSLATYLRECIDSNTMPTFKTDRDEHGGVSLMRPKDFRLQIAKAFKSEVYNEYPDAFKAIAWRNKIVDDYNESIREAMYGEEAAIPFEIGERIVAKQPILDLLKFRSEGIESYVATVDEEGTVQAMHTMPHPIFSDVEVYAVTFENSRGNLVTGYLPSRAGSRVVERRLKELSEEARMERRRWPAFWQYKGMFADLAPCHALTTHRSQGSTYRTSFIDLDDLWVNYKRNNTEGLRMIYTAVTRASKSLALKWG